MSNLTRLDEDEIFNYRELTSGKGNMAKEAMESYLETLGTISSEGFGSKDDSSAHKVIDSLIEEVSTISATMDDVDSMIDSLIEIISNDILLKENRISDSVLED